MPVFLAPRPFTFNRPVVVALHSSGAGGRQWEPYRSWLLPNATLITPDLMGYDSAREWPPGAPISLEAEARRLAPLLARGDDGVHLVGHSYGGAVAMQIALRWPERVKSLTLFEPSRFALLRHDSDDATLWQQILRTGRSIGTLATLGRRQDAASAFVDYWSGPGAWERLSERRRQAITLRMHKVQAEFEALFSDPTPVQAYRGLTMPVRVLRGSRSPAPSLRLAQRLVAACPNAELVDLRGLGHMGPVEQPLRLLGLLPGLMAPSDLDQAA